jgi:uncharacterized protein (DUF433 family)
MDWHDRIKLDPAILVGKPCIKGTRMSVEIILEALAGGWSMEEILEQWDHISADDIRACIAYAGDVVRREYERSPRKRPCGSRPTREPSGPPALDALRLDGHDVARIRESAPGVADTDVLGQASAEERRRDPGQGLRLTGLPREGTGSHGIILASASRPDLTNSLPLSSLRCAAIIHGPDASRRSNRVGFGCEHSATSAALSRTQRLR